LTVLQLAAEHCSTRDHVVGQDLQTLPQRVAQA
jgi:hypothetical protein